MHPEHGKDKVMRLGGFLVLRGLRVGVGVTLGRIPGTDSFNPTDVDFLRAIPIFLADERYAVFLEPILLFLPQFTS